MAAWSVQKQVKVAVLLALSVALFYGAFTIDGVLAKVFEHSNVLKLDASNFNEKVGGLHLSFLPMLFLRNCNVTKTNTPLGVHQCTCHGTRAT